MSKKKRKWAAIDPGPVVTYRSFTVDFVKRTVNIDGRVIGPIESNAVTFPILTGDAVFMSRDAERVG